MDSPFKILSFAYPEINWKQWKFNQVPKGYWNNPSNVKDFFENNKEIFKIKQQEDWYKITNKDLIDNGGGGLLNQFNGSPFKILSFAYPEINWKQWKFNRVSNGYWNNPSNVKDFFENNKEIFKIKQQEDWYKISSKDLIDNGGGGLLQQFDGSPFKILSFAYPEINWKQWKFNQVSNGYWKDKKNIRLFMEDLGHSLKFESFQDW